MKRNVNISIRTFVNCGILFSQYSVSLRVWQFCWFHITQKDEILSGNLSFSDLVFNATDVACAIDAIGD